MQNILHHTKLYYFAITWIKLDTLFLTNVCMYSCMYLHQNTTKFNSDTVCTYCKMQTFHWTTCIKTLQNSIQLTTKFTQNANISLNYLHSLTTKFTQNANISLNYLHSLTTKFNSTHAKSVSHCKHFIKFLITMSAVGAMVVFNKFYMKILF